MSRLEDVSRLVTEIIWEIDDKHLLTFVTPRAFEILGLLPEQMIGKKLTDLGTFFSATQQEIELDWSKPFRNYLFRIDDVDGNEKTFLIGGLPHFDKDTWQAKGFYGTARDITEGLDAEKSLRMLSEIIEQNPSMVFVTDLDGNISYVNAMFTEMSGYSSQEAMGQNPRLLQSGETSEQQYEEMWKTILSGEKWQGEIKNKRKDGSFYWVSVTINPIRMKDDSIRHFVAVHEDITERRAAEDRLREAKEQAEIANRAKSEILANTSHELRTPLNAIIGFSGSIQKEIFGPLGSKEYATYIDMIHESGQHLLALINDILDVASLEAAQLTLHEETFDLRECVATAILMVTPRVEKKQLGMAYDNGGPGIFISADERRIKQIMLNLLSNAAKFTPGGGEVSVTVDLNDDGAPRICVSDSGIGMHKDEIITAMTQFGQVESDYARKYHGTGLGLPLTQGLVNAHGGTLEILSEKGEGTTVKICLPKSRVVSSP